VNETHWVFVPGGGALGPEPVARVRDPLGLAPGLGVVLGRDSHILKHNVGRRKRRAGVLDLDQGVPAASGGLETLHLEPIDHPLAGFADEKRC
jgi:hypothetical protein